MSEYWIVNTRGGVVKAPRDGKKHPGRLQFGNVFKTKRVAQEAQEKIKQLFKRLKKKYGGK